MAAENVFDREQFFFILLPVSLVAGILGGFYLDPVFDPNLQTIILTSGLVLCLVLFFRFFAACLFLLPFLSFAIGVWLTSGALAQQRASLPLESDSGKAFKISARVRYSWQTQYGSAVKVDQIQVLRPQSVNWHFDRLTVYLPEMEDAIPRHAKLEAWIRLNRRNPPKPHAHPIRELRERYLPIYVGSVKNRRLMTIEAEPPAPSALNQGNRELLNLFLRGQPSYLWRERLDAFGLGHLLAISGLHCIFVYLGLQLLLLPLRRPVLRFWLTACGLLLFAHWVGWSASVTRAALMLILWHLLPHQGRTRSWPRLWCALLVVGLVSDPLMFLFRGFWYSYAASLGLILGMRYKPKTPLDHPWLVRLRPFLAIFAAQLFVIPINLMFDNHTAFGSFFWNILGFGFLVVLLGLLALALLGSLIPPLAVVANGVEQLAATILEWLALMPTQFEMVRFPAEPALVLATLLTLILLLAYARREFRWYAALVVLSFFLTFGRPLAGERLVMLDVDQGLCVLLTDAQGNALLFDAGGKMPMGTELKQVLTLFGARDIRGVYLSHANADHYNFLEAMRPEFPVYIPRGQQDAFEDIAILDKFEFTPISAGFTFTHGDVAGSVLWPRENLSYPNDNEESLVILLSGEKWSYLATGDAGLWMEDRLVLPESHDPLFLQVGHHGSKSATGRRFLEQVDPQWALISCGRANRFGHPHPKVTGVLAQESVPTLITAETGSIQIMAAGAITLREPAKSQPAQSE